MSKKVQKYIDNLGEISGRKVIVTGANSGFGYEICKIALAKKAKIVMACRNSSKAEQAKNNLLEDYPDAFIDIEIYDQSCMSSTKNFAIRILEKHNDFYALILNAGILKPKKGLVTEDNFPLTSGTNYFGNLVIVNELKSFLDNSEMERRIIFQASLGIYLGKIKTIEKSLLNSTAYRMKQYNNSKLAMANIYYWCYMNNTNKNVKYLLCEPGSSNTNIIRNYPAIIKPAANVFMRLIFHSSTCGSLTACKLLCDEAYDGDYYRPKHLMGFKGLPKKVIFKQKLFYPNLIEESMELVYGKIN